MCFFNVGNHNSDAFPIDVVLKFLDMENDYYSYVFGDLKNMILYEEPLHTIVTIDKNINIYINGIEGHYQNITPNDIGMGNTWNGVSIKPRTSSLYISL